MMSEKTDVLVIGAGVLGCFAARCLSRYRLDVTVVEQREDVCTGISKANTGIIYQGYDQHPGTLKAQLCRKASESFPQLCAELDVPYRKCGLLMLSFGDRGDKVLDQKLRQGLSNGVTGIRILNARQVYERELFLCDGIRQALYAPETCVVNPWDLGIAAFENARANGVTFCFQEQVLGIRREGRGFVVETTSKIFRAQKILCCAGLKSDLIWELANKPRIRILPQAADYLVFDTSVGDMIRHVISVEPETEGEGLTLVPAVDGNILAGPTRRPCDGPDGATTEEGLAELRRKCKRLIPELPLDQVIRSFAGTRPNPWLLNEDGSISGQSLKDFVILEEDGFFALMGIKTPGLTCANELGMYLTDRILRTFPSVPEENKEYDPVRKGIPRVAAMLTRDPDSLAELPFDYREFVCRCRKVSRGEILEAIRRGAVSVDGIKRRTGSGMGRCQGGYCMDQILHLLAEETGNRIEDFIL